MATVPAAPATPKPTPAGSGLDAGAWVGIGIGIASVSIAVIGIILACLRFLYVDNVIGRRPKRRTRERCRHLSSQEEDIEQGEPLTSMPTASSGKTNTTRSKAEQTRAERAAGSRCMKALKEIYQSTGSYVQMLPWVDDDKRHIMDIYTKLQLEKGDDDLKGEVKSYWDIFNLKSRGDHPIIRAILRGWAGLGKTVLLDKIAYDWACGTVDGLKRYKLVFVLNMHSLQQKSDVSDALFDQLLDDMTINREDLKNFITANHDSVLFLLDGFNEFKSTKLDETKFGSILQMLNGKGDYKECSVLVTTRPSHYDRLVKHTLIQKPFAVVNVLGFSKDDIKEYVHTFYSEEQSQADGLLERITSSDVLSDLVTNPMLLLLMCLLWRESATLPDTMFRLCNQALFYIFKRKTHMSTEAISRLFTAIGKVALDGLLSLDQKLSFQEYDFDPGSLDMAIRAGILTSQRVLKGIDSCKIVHFIHKIFQEFCAAVYFQSVISNRETKQFQIFFRQVSDLAWFEYLLRFCCGDNEGPRTNSILNIISEKVKHEGDLNDSNLQLALNCYFESQSQTLPPSGLVNSVIAQNLTIYNDLSRGLSTSFMYFLKNVSHQEKGGGIPFFERIRLLTMTLNNFLRLGPEFVNCVNKMANLCCFKVTRRLGKSKYHGGLTLLGLLYSLRLKAMTQLRAVGFNGCDLTRSSMELIVGELSDLPNLVALDLSDNETLAGSGRSWSHLGGVKTLNKVDLRHCGLRSDDLEPIAVGLCNLPNLVELDLSDNETLASSGRSWSHLREVKTLNKVDLRHCGLRSDDLMPIAVGLSYLQNLVELDLSDNETLATSGWSWSHLREVKTLNKVNLRHCGLRSNDLEPIAVGLSDLPKLVKLNLSYNRSLAGCGRSWSFLAKIKYLRKLSLVGCDLTADDKTQITEALSQMTNLEVSY